MPSTPALPARNVIMGRPNRRRFAMARTILALMLREMSTQYGRNPGGYLWALLQPLGSILMLALGFSLLIHTPALGTSFILFYASGMLAYDMYQDVSSTTARALQFSRPLLSYPAVTWMDAILARLLLNLLTNAFVAMVLLTGIILYTGVHVSVAIGPVVLAMALAAVVGLAVGCMNCVLGGLYPTWNMVWSIISRPLFIASAILFLYSDLPRGVRDILWYNPLVHVVGLMRRGIYHPIYHADYVSVWYVMGVSLPLIALGLLLIQRYYKEILSN